MQIIAQNFMRFKERIREKVQHLQEEEEHVDRQDTDEELTKIESDEGDDFDPTVTFQFFVATTDAKIKKREILIGK